MNYDTSDSAVTSVVGEMLILVLVIILVSLFATSAFNLLPGDRETMTNVFLQKDNTTHLIFWHKGGDWVDKNDLTITATPKEGGSRIPLTIDGVFDYAGKPVEVFDLGGNVTVKTENLTAGITYEIRVATPRNVILAEVFRK
ncbi:MAG TPA: type IV pilin N-terminal domain-containing protein [Methanocorpusculum sp.]|nr:type IV pilin N-terminal domain-containing protein [Methanocorpusculum sp.]HJK80264.1 type IV pilin N-terminal domain-containing protein [Methanocorpusculum sp.]